jgi:hypothetical protein
MAMPCKPLARAAAIKSSGLEMPSPEKKECVCRSMLNAIAQKAEVQGKKSYNVKKQERIADRNICNGVTY